MSIVPEARHWYGGELFSYLFYRPRTPDYDEPLSFALNQEDAVGSRFERLNPLGEFQGSRGQLARLLCSCQFCLLVVNLLRPLWGQGAQVARHPLPESPLRALGVESARVWERNPR